MFRSLFYPAYFRKTPAPAIDWHTSDRFPATEEADMIIFGIAYPETDYTLTGIYDAFSSLEWGKPSLKIQHLGMFRMASPGDAESLKSFLDYHLKKNTRVRFYIYGQDVKDLSLWSGLMTAERSVAQFLPGIFPDNANLTGELFRKSNFKYLVLAGLQKYFTPRKFSRMAVNPYVNLVRLSDLNEDAGLLETAVRQAFLVTVDYRVLARKVTGSDMLPFPAGLDVNQWVALHYYTGLSVMNRIAVIPFPGGNLNPAAEYESPDAYLLAMGVWHLAEGLKNKTNDFPLISLEKLQKQEIFMDNIRSYVYFNPETGRWWLEWTDRNGINNFLPLTNNMVRKIQNGYLLEELLKYFHS